MHWNWLWVRGMNGCFGKECGARCKARKCTHAQTIWRMGYASTPTAMMLDLFCVCLPKLQVYQQRKRSETKRGRRWMKLPMQHYTRTCNTHREFKYTIDVSRKKWINMQLWKIYIVNAFCMRIFVSICSMYSWIHIIHIHICTYMCVEYLRMCALCCGEPTYRTMNGRWGDDGGCNSDVMLMLL